MVTPFVQVGTYPTRNFATLGLLYLKPSFTRAYIQSVYPYFSLTSIGQASVPILCLSTYAETCVFNKQSLSPILCHIVNLTIHSFSLSYWAKLSSSFRLFLSFTLVHLYHSTCVGFQYGYIVKVLSRDFLKEVCHINLYLLFIFVCRL